MIHERFDVENLATQLITDAAVVGMQQLQTKPVSDEYQQSKQASRGAGHITQTTIEQQWESQLINDAEFTANRQLPSVTFDVNNSYVSQQLGQRVGEEVSRFQHVDPPRNPNGFWQRAWNSVEDVFEHRALIAEGRAAANSEVMRESLGHAPANQQHYLDLGYTDSVAQYGAGWIGMAEVPAAKSIQLGKQATRLLAENWGFFNRNGVKDLFHTVTNPDAGQAVLNKIDPRFFNDKSRFGKAFYVSEVPDTTLTELEHHNLVGVDTIRFNFNQKAAKILDLTKPRIAQKWGYVGGDISSATNKIGLRARESGFNVIRYPSERGQGSNLAIFNDFENLLQPQMVVPTPILDLELEPYESIHLNGGR